VKEGAKRFSSCRTSVISFPPKRTACRHLASTTLQRRVRMEVMYYLSATIDPRVSTVQLESRGFWDIVKKLKLENINKWNKIKKYEGT